MSINLIASTQAGQEIPRACHSHENIPFLFVKIHTYRQIHFAAWVILSLTLNKTKQTQVSKDLGRLYIFQTEKSATVYVRATSDHRHSTRPSAVNLKLE